MLVLFEYKINKNLARLMKKKGGKAHINTTDNEKGEITADTTKIKKRIISVYHMIYIPIKWKTCKKWENPL